MHRSGLEFGVGGLLWLREKGTVGGKRGRGPEKEKKTE